MFQFWRRSAPVFVPAPAAVAHYPPPAEALPVPSPDELLAAQQPLVDKILDVAAFGHPDSVRNAGIVIRNYAAYVHLLPASEAEHFSAAGGLLRYGLELAYYCARGTHSMIYSIASSDVRQRVEPDWRLATLIAGLLAGLPDAVSRLTVERAGVRWQPLLQPLYDYLSTDPTASYHVQWQAAPTNISYILPMIVPPALASQLSRDPACFAALLDTLAGSADPTSNPIAKVVQLIKAQLIARDLKLRKVYVQRPQLGARPELHLLDAMRGLIAAGTWRVNEVGHRLWYFEDTLYLASSALPELRAALKAAGRIDPLGEDRTLVEMLVSAKVLKDGRTLSIQPGGVRSSLSCFELADVHLLLDPETLPVLATCSVPERGEQPMPEPAADSADSADTGELSPESLEDMRCRERLGAVGHKLQELDTDQAQIVDEDAYFTVEALSAVGLEPRDLLPLLAKEGLLAMPAGATRKITSLAGIDYVGITDRGIRIIWPLE